MDEAIEKIKVALEDRNIRVVAQRLHISPFSIYRIINDEHKRGPHKTTIMALAKYLGVEVNEQQSD